MSLLRNLNTRLGRIGIDPNISIPPKLTPSLPRGPVIRLPKKPPSIGRLPSIAEPMPIVRKLPVGEPIPFVPPIIQPEPMPVEPISPIAAPMPIRLPIDMPMPVAEPMPISMADPIEVPVAQPMPMPIQQPIATQPLERMDMPINKKRDFMSIERIPTPPKRQDFMSIGGPGGGFGLDERDAIDSGVPSAPSPGIGLGAVDDLGVPIFGNRDTPGANSTAFERKNDPESLRLQGGPKYTTMPVGPSVPFETGLAPDIDPPASVTTPPPAPVATNQPRPAPTEVAPTTQTDPVATTTTTSAGQALNNPFAASVTQRQSTMDPITQQLLFGLDGQGGFIPGAMRAAEKTFYDDEGNPIVIGEQVAGFSPDQIAAIEMQRQSLGLQDPYIQDARSALQASMQAYDPSITGRFFNPFEDRVVQQTIQDVMEQGAKSDIGALAGNIARGGQSAFGSRARLGAAERQEALGRGLSEALGSLRARGFSEAQRAGMGEFARQTAAQRAGASGLASLGAQAAGASLSDIGALYGMGTQQQTQAQRMLDAQRRNLQQRQMTPLLQYQALQPFVSMAPAGQFQTDTQFVPAPSPMQSGLGVGLSAFGALGQLYGGKN